MSNTLYSARFQGPTLIERGKDQTVSVDVEINGAPVTLTSGAMTVYKPGGSTLVDGVAGTVAGGVFTSATIGAALTADEGLGQGWLIKMDLVIAGASYTFFNDSILAAARLYPPISQTDLISRHSEALSLSSTANLQHYITEAWRDITISLYTDGIPYWKWRTPSALRAVHLSRSLELMFLDYATLMQGNDRYLQLASKYRQDYVAEYTQLRSTIDVGEDNNLDADKTSGAAVIMLQTGRRR
tara:strand:+ start:865 stop:1590 length:726 start_codon:yes stop_codon:yes gene_type:complete